MPSLTVNGTTHAIDSSPDTPLLWVLRDHLGLTGTKYGCGQGQCGACVVHLDGRAVRACQTPLARVGGAAVTTIEGLSADGGHPLQRAWIAEDVAQCGYCQAGMLMAGAALLAASPRPSDTAIDDALSGQLCRCGTYQRIRRAIQRASTESVR